MQNLIDYDVTKELDLIIDSIEEINQPNNFQYSNTQNDENFWIYLPLGKHLREK